MYERLVGSCGRKNPISPSPRPFYFALCDAAAPEQRFPSHCGALACSPQSSVPGRRAASFDACDYISRIYDPRHCLRPQQAAWVSRDGLHLASAICPIVLLLRIYPDHGPMIVPLTIENLIEHSCVHSSAAVAVRRDGDGTVCGGLRPGAGSSHYDAKQCRTRTKDTSA